MRLLIFAAVFISVLFHGGPAFAYLDPGTGSMLLQLILGGIAGVLIVARLYWSRLKRLLFSSRSSQKTVPDPPDPRNNDEAR